MVAPRTSMRSMFNILDDLESLELLLTEQLVYNRNTKLNLSTKGLYLKCSIDFVNAI